MHSCNLIQGRITDSYLNDPVIFGGFYSNSRFNFDIATNSRLLSLAYFHIYVILTKKFFQTKTRWVVCIFFFLFCYLNLFFINVFFFFFGLEKAVLILISLILFLSELWSNLKNHLLLSHPPSIRPSHRKNPFIHLHWRKDHEIIQLKVHLLTQENVVLTFLLKQQTTGVVTILFVSFLLTYG